MNLLRFLKVLHLKAISPVILSHLRRLRSKVDAPDTSSKSSPAAIPNIQYKQIYHIFFTLWTCLPKSKHLDSSTPNNDPWRVVGNWAPHVCIISHADMSLRLYAETRYGSFSANEQISNVLKLYPKHQLMWDLFRMNLHFHTSHK